MVTLVSSNNKTDLHDITEILLKVALNTINQTSIIDYSNQKDGDIVEGICVIMYLNYLRPSNKPDKGKCTLRCIRIVNLCSRGRRGRDHMIVGFTTTCAICAYQH